MWVRLGEATRIDAARGAIAGLMARWPEARPVGLVAFGHRRARDCADVALLRRPGRDAAAVAAAAGGILPHGRGAATEAVRLAAETVGPAGGEVILVASGAESCHPDPCGVAQALARSAPRLVLHTIAFGTDDPAAIAQLRCMAEATGGRGQVARNAAELAAALDRAAAQATPGPRAYAPRGEPVPLPRLVVTVRICADCDPLPGEATIELRRGASVVATDGAPYGRFLDLPPGDYEVTAETPLVRGGPVPVTVPPRGTVRADVVLDAGWLVADPRLVPSGRRVTQPAELALDGVEAAPGVAAFLVPAGRHRIAARIGNAEAEAEAEVAPGDVAALRLPMRLGALALRAEDFKSGTRRVTVTREGDDAPVLDLVPAGAEVMPLAAGRYRVTDGEAASDVDVPSGGVVVLVLPPGG